METRNHTWKCELENCNKEDKNQQNLTKHQAQNIKIHGILLRESQQRAHTVKKILHNNTTVTPPRNQTRQLYLATLHMPTKTRKKWDQTNMARHMAKGRKRNTKHANARKKNNRST